MILLYFMDGLKFDMAKEHMPFLSSLYTKPLKSEFGYSCACHATMYTGKYIDEHNTWFVWKKGDHSPYRWINRVPLLKYCNFIPAKIVLSRVTRLFHKNTSYPGIPMMVNLPLKYWGEFEPCEDAFWSEDDYLPGTRTLFKELRQNQIPHKLVGLSKKGDVFTEEADVDYSAQEFIYYFIGELDSCMHKHGEHSDASIHYLQMTDDFIRRTYDKAIATGKPVTIICYSDHGHIDIERKIDPNEIFKSHGRNLKRYLQLTESTFLRFWFRNDREREEVLPILAEMQASGLGFVLDEATREKYHLRFRSNEHGDAVFHLNAPNIFTHTIWGFGKKQHSMHGYLPELRKHYGIFAANRPLISREFAYLTDIFPTILAELGMDSDPTLHGEPLLCEQAP